MKSVHVAISDLSGNVLKQGPAMPASSEWWTDETTVQVGRDARVLVTAEDLPGHITEVVKSLSSDEPTPSCLPPWGEVEFGEENVSRVRGTRLLGEKRGLR